MRTTRGKPTLDTRTGGPDATLAQGVARALVHEEQVDRVTHGFHTYPAGLHPDAARDLLALLPGQRMHDPFCGGGTTLIEGLCDGRVVTGADINPIARLVATARTRLVDAEVLTAFRSRSRKLTEAARNAPPVPTDRIPDDVRRALSPWYAPGVAAELEVLRDGVIDVDGVVGDLLRATFSSLLVKVSWRRSDTSPEREVHERPRGTTAVLFHKKARELGRRLEALREVAPAGARSPDVRAGSATDPWPEPTLDLVLTSPPYPAVYDYLPIQDLRHAWLGLSSDAGAEIGARRDWQRDPISAARRWQAASAAWMERAARALAPGGHVAVVIGDGLVDSGPIDALTPTVETGASVGLELRAFASLARPDHARRTTRWEHGVVLQRR